MIVQLPEWTSSERSPETLRQNKEQVPSPVVELLSRTDRDEYDYEDGNENEEDSYEDDDEIEEYEYEEFQRPVYPIVIPPAKLWEFPPTVQLPVWDPHYASDLRESSDDNFGYTTYEFIHGKWRTTC